MWTDSGGNQPSGQGVQLGPLQRDKISHGHQRLNAGTQKDLTEMIGKRWGDRHSSHISKSPNQKELPIEKSQLEGHQVWSYVKLHFLLWHKIHKWSSLQPSYWGTSLPAWRSEASETWKKNTTKKDVMCGKSPLQGPSDPSATTGSGTLAGQWWPNHRHLAKLRCVAKVLNITSWFGLGAWGHCNVHNLQMSGAIVISFHSRGQKWAEHCRISAWTRREIVHEIDNGQQDDESIKRHCLVESMSLFWKRQCLERLVPRSAK